MEFFNIHKKYFCIVVLLLSLSCQKKKISANEIECNYKKDQAQNDFKFKKYIWSNFQGQGANHKGNEEFAKLIAKFNINYKDISVSCIIDGNEQFENCYETEMNQLLKNKFGTQFFDSLKLEAEKEYISKRKDSIFTFGECDQRSRHPNTENYNEQFSISQKEFFNGFTYPEKYLKRKNKELPSSTMASFILMKDGSIKNLITKSDFENAKNKVFEKLFNKKIENYVQNIQWKPATIAGIPVNSEMEVNIIYE
ncbi:hypothetical protein [Soonwooa sp.]|uniref:hypothetical protein n=1 Tax=Soonwooa sp. TaxID=1938592 RepID=UPI002637C60F|nr:hypothetical protein [Soonwooa sp.]